MNSALIVFVQGRAGTSVSPKIRVAKQECEAPVYATGSKYNNNKSGHLSGAMYNEQIGIAQRLILISSRLAMNQSSECLQQSDQGPWRRMRYLLTFLITFAIVAGFCMRTALSIAIVAMTNNSTNTDFPTFDWDQTTQGTTLSSFFWGYVVFNIPFAVLVTRFGARYILLCALAVCTLATFLTPVAANQGGWQAVCALRALQGASQGALFPSMNALLAKWVTPSERGRLASICFSGMQIGNVIALPLSGELASSDGGWPSIFYVFGGLGVVWCCLWFFLGYDSPAEHPYVTQGEREYIQSFYTPQQSVKTFKTPWLSIVTSIPLWATFITHCVQNWGFYMLLTEMPTYMNDVLQYDIKQNGLLTALPYIVMLLLIFTFGWAADFLTSNKYFTINTSRKFFNTVGLMFPMATMIGLSFVGLEQKEAAVALLVLSAGLNAGVYVGFQVNHLDLSPRFASILMGITNGIGNAVSMAVPLVVGAIVTTKGDEDQWHIVFWISAGMYLLGTLAFLLFGSTETQPWNDDSTCTPASDKT